MVTEDSSGGYQIERHWIAVSGDEIVAKADTKQRAAMAAEHLGETYTEVVAVPKMGFQAVHFDQEVGSGNVFLG